MRKVRLDLEVDTYNDDPRNINRTRLYYFSSHYSYSNKTKQPAAASITATGRVMLFLECLTHRGQSHETVVFFIL